MLWKFQLTVSSLVEHRKAEIQPGKQTHSKYRGSAGLQRSSFSTRNKETLLCDADIE